jgi:hypothetical protein
MAPEHSIVVADSGSNLAYMSLMMRGNKPFSLSRLARLVCSSATGIHSRGVLYIGIGDRCTSEAAVSAASLRRVSPEVHISLVTDRPCQANGNPFDKVMQTRSKANPFRTKVDCLELSPYEVTLFIDTDTLVLQPIEEVFDHFEGFDFAICREPYKTRTRPPELIAYEHPFEINSGVFLYRRSPAFRDFWTIWQTLTNAVPEEQMRPSGSVTDQGPCKTALGRSDLAKLRLLILDSTLYNARIITWPHLEKDGLLDKVKIMHGRGAAEFLAQHRARIS